VVDKQTEDLGVQMRDLDEFVARARSQNAQHGSQHSKSMDKLSSAVGASFSDISSHFKETLGRVNGLGDDVEAKANELRNSLGLIDESMCQPLSNLREDISNTALRFFDNAGATPEKVQYQYPTDLPRTKAHEVLLAGLDDEPSPSKPAPVVFSDVDTSEATRPPSRPPSSGLDQVRNPLAMSLREVDPNLTAGSIVFEASASTMSLPQDSNAMPSFRRSARMRAPQKQGKGRNAVIMEGPENVPPSAFSQSASSRRKSPRLH